MNTRCKEKSGKFFGRFGLVLWMAVLMAVVCPQAKGTLLEMVPSPADLYDLDHYKYYTWGIDTLWGENEHAVSATLSFDNIRNWDNNPNVLYVHLLDDAAPGVTVGRDNQGGGDYFDGQGVVLTVYNDLPNVAQDLSYSFTPEEIAVLNAYAPDGRFGLGFDPDCHFYNSGVALVVAVEEGTVPEPATMLLLLGAVPFYHIRKRTAR